MITPSVGGAEFLSELVYARVRSFQTFNQDHRELSILSDENQEPQIDETMPGSSPDENDGVTQQLDGGDTLLGGSLADPLDTGWNPPDRDPGINVPTQAEQLEGDSLDDRLAMEVPDVTAELDDAPADEADEADEVGDERSGRLVLADDPDGDLVGEDVGIDGAAASAEEAAVHVVQTP